MSDPSADGPAGPDAVRQGSSFLLYRDGDGRQRIVALDERDVTVGRDQGLDVALTWDGEVSRLHAHIERLGSRWVVVDDGLSRNGTWVNGHRVSGRQRLEDGDTIRFGNTPVTFSCSTLTGGTAPRTVTAVDVAHAVRISESQRRVLVALCRPYKGGARYATPPTNQQVADELFLSVDAVKTHLRTLFAKFDLDALGQNQKRARLVEIALRLGIVTDQEL
ncbi:FHA domain-containing protein [Nocardioides sp. MAHUQ-72]|uniref:FHA domain-containing protein n=1 Tax=unclassified Nocardioides TaxID=2615069 RepID=UPI003624404F